MNQDKLSLTKKSVLVLAVGFIAYIMFLYAFLDLNAIIDAVRGTNLFNYSLAFLLA